MNVWQAAEFLLFFARNRIGLDFFIFILLRRTEMLSMEDVDRLEILWLKSLKPRSWSEWCSERTEFDHNWAATIFKLKLRKFWTQHRGLICFSGSPLDWLEVHSGNILVKGLVVILMKVKTSKHGTDWSCGQSDFQNFKARWTRSEPLNQFTWLWLFLDWVVLRPSSLWVTCSEVWREQKRNKHWRRRPRNRPSAAVSSERDAQKEFEDSFFEPLGPKYGGMKLSLSIFRLVFVTSVSYCCVFCFSGGPAWSGRGAGGRNTCSR